MENTPKTISFRLDDATLESMEYLKKNLFKDKEVGNSELIRYALSYLQSSFGRGMADSEYFYELVQSYIKTIYLKAPSTNFRMLDEILYAMENAYGEYTVEEVEELGKLYDELNPITLVQLIRFKNKIVPITFLKIMGQDEDELEDMTETKLADLILQKFSEEEFRKEAKRLFHIES
ncbi:hypothetical protein [Lysinibacillus varians]|uniref:CopG family transcriptional regulator n=1 Tax=Lysinibacillus varians TaxID=1145276 RepID=A0ABY2T7G6_9BACI|nr:hypothetical protein [Lysinibacillus varians]AHN24440.1 hypothetical protein T479_18615 [Lysinibacillus varians]TKI51183.1 hypothetical protein FC752_22390 [Lysinibacillus varians]